MCGGGQKGGKGRSNLFVGPTVLIHLNNSTAHKLQYLPFILNNGGRRTIKQLNKVINGIKKRY
jgi:hypothetical protein